MSVLQDDLLKELECPVCLHYLMPPIALCKNGHSICKICRNKVQKCPTCKDNFTDNRSISLENIVRGLHYPCHNKTNGCGVVLPYELMMEHEEICGLGIHECPLKKKSIGFDHCKWMGTWGDLKTHIERDHGEDFILECSSYSPIYEGVTMLFVFKEVFLYQIHRDGDKWYFTAMIIGTKTNASRFKVSHTFRIENELEVLMKCNSICSYTEIFPEIFKSKRCLCLHDEELNKFKTDGKINMTAEISTT